MSNKFFEKWPSKQTNAQKRAKRQRRKLQKQRRKQGAGLGKASR